MNKRSIALFPLLFVCSLVNGGWEDSRASGAIYWFSGDELDYIGTMEVTLPWFSENDHRLEANLSAATNIEGTASDLTLLVRDLDYRGRLGWSPAGRLFSIEVGQWGRERVDEDGRTLLRWAGGSWSSTATHTFQNGPWLSIRGGAVFDQRETDADAVFFLHSGWRLHSGLFFDLAVDGQIDSTHLDSDGRVGVGYSWMVAEGRRFSAILRRTWSRTSLGLGEDGWLAGFEISEARDGDVDNTSAGSQVWGETALGAGEHTALGRFQLGVSSPKFISSGWQAVLFVDANVLTSDDTDDIYYFYHLGVERPFREKYRTGVWLYHRSNHRLAEPGDTITSLNTIETGIESKSWQRAGITDRRLTFRARLGLVVNSSFGDAYEPVARGGAMWRFAQTGNCPFVRLEGEVGSVDHLTAAAGLSFDRRWELRVEYRRDDQWFRVDSDFWALVVGTGF